MAEIEEFRVSGEIEPTQVKILDELKRAMLRCDWREIEKFIDCALLD